MLACARVCVCHRARLLFDTLLHTHTSKPEYVTSCYPEARARASLLVGHFQSADTAANARAQYITIMKTPPPSAISLP